MLGRVDTGAYRVRMVFGVGLPVESLMEIGESAQQAGQMLSWRDEESVRWYDEMSYNFV